MKRAGDLFPFPSSDLNRDTVNFDKWLGSLAFSAFISQLDSSSTPHLYLDVF